MPRSITKSPADPQQHEMLDAVAAHQDQAALGIERGHIDHGKAAPPAAGGGQPAGEPEPPGRPRGDADEPENENESGAETQLARELHGQARMAAGAPKRRRSTCGRPTGRVAGR